jgi:hypothetical protein
VVGFAHCTGQIPRRRGISTIANSYRRRANGTLPDVLFCRARCADPDAMNYGGDQVKRREFITLLGTSVAVWPLAARAQQASGMRRVGVLMGYAENDPEAKVFFAGFTQRLAELGWVEGRNLRMDVRWAPGSVDRMRTFARELVELQPDVILANSTPVTAALQRGDPDDPNCIRRSFRPRRLWLCCESGPPRREHYRVQHCRTVAAG